MKSARRDSKDHVKQTKQSIEQSLSNLQIIKDLKIRRLFEFIPFAIVFFVTIQAFAGWYSKTGVDLLYLSGGIAITVSIILTRSLFEEYPNFFEVLWRRNVLTLRMGDKKRREKDSAEEINRLILVFLHALQERMNSRIDILFGMFGLLVSGWLIWLLDEGALTEAYTNVNSVFSVYSLVFLIRLTFFVTGFVGGVIGWRVIVMANSVSQIGRDFDFELQVNHPDGCGGLRPIGDLCLKLAYIISPFPILLSLWLVFINFF